MFKTHELRTIIALFVLIALGGSVALAGAQPASPPADHEAHHPATPTAPGQPSMDPMMGTAEFDLIFIDMMIMHHQGAVAMAEVALERGEHSELVQLAEDIITAQTDEIAQLQAWRDAWYPGAPAMTMDEMMGGMGQMMQGMPGMQAMGGTMTMMPMMDPSRMAESLRATAEPFDLAFIDAMIPHHLSALMMAEMAVQQATHPELAVAAQTMFDAQVDEIQLMRGWRSEWYGSTATPVS
jgi:uncharacterized protein (DUF305 family)